MQNRLLTLYGYRIKRHRYRAAYEREVRAALDRERWPADRMRAFQDARLRVVVQRAYGGSPYYREVFDRLRLKSSDIRTVEDSRKLPLLTKETVRARGPDLLAEHPPRRDSLNGHTSGTTGSPLSIWYDRQTRIVHNAIDRRHKVWAGMGEREWIGHLLGRMIVSPAERWPPFWRTNSALRQVWFSSFHLTVENLDDYVAEMHRRQLQVLEGYPSTLYVLAQHLLRAGGTLPLRAGISSSERLHPIQREAIEHAFECRLFDFYAAAERVIFAAECDAMTASTSPRITASRRSLMTAVIRIFGVVRLPPPSAVNLPREPRSLARRQFAGKESAIVAASMMHLTATKQLMAQVLDQTPGSAVPNPRNRYALIQLISRRLLLNDF